VGYFPTQDFLPYFVITEHGFDRRHDVRLVEKTFTGGSAVIDAMVKGDIDIGPAVGTVPILEASTRGLVPGRIVAVAGNNFTDPDHPSMAVLAGPSIRTWKDLRGQRVAVNAKTSLGAAALVGRLRLEDVPDVTLVEIGFPNMGLSITNGTVVAASMYEPFIAQSILRGDGHLLGWVGGDRPFPRAELTAVLASAELHQRRPDAVKAYLRAHLDAVRWIAVNPGLARALLARRLELRPEYAAKIRLVRWAQDGRNDPAAIDALQPWLIGIGALAHRVPSRMLYDETLLTQVLAERAAAPGRTGR
jgi:NitT/TauT family transport system substrate-binding protein